MKWRNWSGRRESRVEALSFVRSEADAVEQVRTHASAGRTIRVAGAGHSHAPLVTGSDVILDTSGLSGVVDVQTDTQSATIRAGSPIYSLGVELHRHGLALKNQGDIDRQLLAGAVSTGTHGTGRGLQNISASVLGVRLILASGDVVDCDAHQNAELFEVARLSTGGVGLITQFQMQLRDSVVLQESGGDQLLDDFIDDIPELIRSNDRFEFFWYPESDQATIKKINPVSSSPEYPLAEEGRRRAWSYEVLPSHRPVPHTEMEYSVPAEQGIDCLLEIRRLLQQQFPDVRWPVEYRTVAADDLWLSMAEGRETVTISVHQDIREDEEPYYRACEEIFLHYAGRPHWGKVNYLSGEQLAVVYPRWHDWWRVRDAYDPAGVFLNEWARGIQPK